MLPSNRLKHFSLVGTLPTTAYITFPMLPSNRLNHFSQVSMLPSNRLNHFSLVRTMSSNRLYNFSHAGTSPSIQIDTEPCRFQSRPFTELPQLRLLSTRGFELEGREVKGYYSKSNTIWQQNHLRLVTTIGKK